MARAPGLIRRLRRAFRGSDRREPGDVNHVSLGSHCHMAQIQKETGLRTRSGPFDWNLSSPVPAAPSVVPVPTRHPKLTWLRIGTSSESVGLRFAEPGDEATIRGLVRSLAASH